MTHWYVKEISKMTGVSVQTLHYYDRIELLKPSVRASNGYRLYSETDLLKLQQIIACKFFRFNLTQIKEILGNPDKQLTNLEQQANLLAKKAKSYLEASEKLSTLIRSVAKEQTIPWQSLIKSIEVYNMTEQLQESWLQEIFTPEEMKEYATLEASLKNSSNLEQKKIIEEEWHAIVNEVKENLAQDPSSISGIALGEKFMKWVNQLYGKEYAHLRTKMFEKGFGEGKGIADSGMTPEIVQWLEQAMDAYWHNRIYTLLDQVGTKPEAKLLIDWNQLLDDMYGNDKSRRAQLYQLALNNEHISEQAKLWLQSISTE